MNDLKSTPYPKNMRAFKCNHDCPNRLHQKRITFSFSAENLSSQFPLFHSGINVDAAQPLGLG